MERNQTENHTAGAVREYLLYGGMHREEYRQISGEMQKSNRKSLMVYSAISTVFLAVMFLLSFVSAEVAESRMVYFATMLIMLVLFVATKYLSEKRPWVLWVSIYVFISVLYTFGIILGTVTRPDEQTVTFVALLLTVPLLFVDYPLRMIASIAVFMLTFIPVALRVKADYVLTADIIDVTVFGTISMIVSTYMMQVKCQRILFEQRALMLSQTDVLTGLNNRNFYERSLSGYPARCKESLSCVFVDVDGLHELNNTRGHEAGDKMLRFVAERMREHFGMEHTYRIGGDEFVSFVPDYPEQDLAGRLRALQQAVEGEGYHISVGCITAQRDKMDMTDMIRDAETHMYQAKKQYYAEKGIIRDIR